MTVWKFDITDPPHEAEIPAAHEVLAVAMQRGRICLWARVNPTAATVTRRFGVYGTGHPMPPGRTKYIGTVFTEGAKYVFHVFEAEEAPK